MANKKRWRWVTEAVLLDGVPVLDADGNPVERRYQVAEIVALDAAEIAARAAAAAAPITVSRLAFVKAAVGAGRANALLAHLDGRDRITRAIWSAAGEVAEDDPDLIAARDAAGIDAAEWRAIFEAAAGG